MTSREIDNYLEHIKDIRRSRARTTFTDFVDYIWNREYEWNWHHVELAKKLQDFYDGKIDRMMVFAPPRHGKTELVSRMYSAWVMGRDMHHNIISCSHTASFANDVTRDVSRIMKSDLYRDVFPDAWLLSGKANENRLTAHGFDNPGGSGTYKAAGAGGNILGSGANTLILDDIIKSAEHAGSKGRRDKLQDWYGRDALTRLAPGGKVLIINTRQNEDDICGRLEQKAKRDSLADQWVVVSFSAINEKGEALWPERFPIATLMAIKAEQTSSAWASLYQQTPTAQEGNIFKRSWFQYYDGQVDVNHTIHFTVDTAYSEDPGADATAILAYYKIGGNMYVTACTAVRMDFPDLIRYVPKWCREHGYVHQSTIAIEPKASGVSAFQELKRNTDLNVLKDKSPTESKEMRAQASTAKIETGRVLFNKFGTGIDELIDECCGFPGAKNDDRMDVLVMAIRRGFQNKRLRMRGRSA